jgi:predicted PurR-regulated permease PerM
VTDKELTLPFYVKASIFSIGILAFFTILYLARSIIVPVVFGIIIAIVLHPLVNFFVRRKMNRVLAIIITLLVSSVIIAGLGALIFSQASQLSESWPVLVEKFAQMSKQAITWTSGYFDINPLKVQAWAAKAKADLLHTSTSVIGQTLVSAGNTLFVMFMVPVYVFVILYYQPLLINVIHKLFSKNKQIQVSEIIMQTKKIIQRYLIGLMIEFVLVAVLNSIVLLLLGIDYAILLGVIGALLNLIPYIGGVVGTAMPMIVALATKDSAWYAVGVLAAYTLVQIIDNNFIVPKIVSSKVKINALASIIVVIAGGALWGIGGMFLSIPLLAIVKLIFDHIEPLKPWGFLLGDTMPPLVKIKTSFIKIIKKAT